MISRCHFLSILLFANVFLNACGGGPGQTTGTPSFAVVNSASTVPAGVAPAGTYVPPGSSDWPLFIYPQPGDPNVDTTQAVQWTAANNARAYQLQIGTTLGGNDVFDSGIITGTSVPMPSLPASVVLYARVRAVLNGWGDDVPAGHWPRGSYTRFRTDDQTTASTFTNIVAGGTLPVGTPVEWSSSPLAVGYRLKLAGASFGGGNAGGFASSDADNGDSGVIHTTHIFINAGPYAKVTATLETIFLNRVETSQINFTAPRGVPTFANYYDLAKKLTGEVRSMADLDNQPYETTVLDLTTDNYGLSAASCYQFMLALSQLLSETRVASQVRALNISLQENGYDTHTLIEMLDDTSNRWVTLDPTFGLVTLRSDNVAATSAEISAAVRAQNWSGLRFEFLTSGGDIYARNYYIDYPLLFVDVESASGSGLVEDPPATLAPYFDSLPLPVSGPQTAYAFQCASGFHSATVDVNGVTRTMECGGPNQLTSIVWANTVQPTAGNNSTSAAWRPRRFTF